MTLVQLSVKHSDSQTCLNVARVAPKCMSKDFGILSIQREDGSLHYLRFASDHTTPSNHLLLPSWLFTLWNEPSVLSVEFYNKESIEFCEEVELSLEVQYPLPFYEDYNFLASKLSTALRSYLLYENGLLLASILGRKYILKVNRYLGEDTVGFFGENTRVSLKFPTPFTSKPMQHTLHFISEICSEIKNEINEKRKNLILSLLPSVFVVSGIDASEYEDALEQLPQNYKSHRISLEFVFKNTEVDSFEAEYDKRLVIFEDKLKSLLEDKNTSTTHFLFDLCQFHLLSENTLLQVTKVMQKNLYENSLYSFIFHVSSEADFIKSESRLQQYLPTIKHICIKRSDPCAQPRAIYETNFCKDYLGLTEEKTRGRVIDLCHQLDFSTAGSLLSAELSSWDQIGGYSNAKEIIKDCLMVSFTHADRAKLLGVQPVRGILLHGPSGCGKTEIVKAIANERLVPVLKIRPTDILSKYFGESEATLRKVFADARKLAPCILYIDNIEVLGSRRGGPNTDNTGVSERLLSTLLNEMDGIDESKNVMVVACTNEVENLDDALLRPGRLDRHILIDYPSKEDIISISKLVCRRISMEIDNEEDLSDFADLLEGKSCAKVVDVLNQYAVSSIEVPLPLSFSTFLDSLLSN